MSTTFDHHVDGTPEAGWATEPRLARISPLDLPAGARLIVVAAHPDDETLGAGGLIASAAARGIAVDVVIATEGEASHPNSTTHKPADLAVLRRAEARAALMALHPAATIDLLGLPDGGLAQHRGELAVAIGEKLTPGAVVIAPWRGDGHPDHEAAALAAADVLRHFPDCPLWEYPIWAWHWGRPGSEDLPWASLHRLDLDVAAERAKAAALGCYPSQHLPLSSLPGDEAILSEPMLAHFRRPFEAFVLTATPAAAAGRYFDDLYAAADDPWGLAERFYEQRKRALLLAALPRPRFRRAFEPGCATGLLTDALARRCDEVLAWDVAQRAVELTRDHVATLGNVDVAQRAIPADWPAGELDLIVLSEVGYYCHDLAALAARVRGSLSADGVVVACHWRHEATEHPRSAQEVHDALGRDLYRISAHVEEDFLLDVWSPRPASVARATGVLG